MFFIVASFVLLFMSMLVARVLINKDKFIRIGLIIFATMYMAVVARVSIVIIGKNTLLTVFAWVGYIAIGVVSILFCVAVVKLLVGYLGFVAERTTPKFSQSRRNFLTKSVGTTLSVATLPMTGYGVYQAVSEPTVKRVSVAKESQHKGLQGFKIVQITDIHVGPTIDADVAARVVDRVNELEPDVVVITGDLVDGSAKYISDYIKPLGSLKSTHGHFS